MNWFSFEGRITRKQWWLTRVAIFAIVVVPLFMIGSMSQAVSEGIFQRNAPLKQAEDVAVAMYLVVLLLCVYVSIATSVKRYHDRNKSGWFVLIVAIPFIGPIIQLVELGFLEGVDKGNRYGGSPVTPGKDPRGMTVGDLMENS